MMDHGYDYYRRLFTSQYRTSEKYMAWARHLLTSCKSPYSTERDEAAVEEIARMMVQAFEIDEAEGTQLDILGAIVGVDRNLGYEMSDGTSVMDDEIFRICIKAQIVKNHWKGQIQELTDAWLALFPETTAFEIQDKQDMTFSVVVEGNFSSLAWEVISHGYILPKPEGVRLNGLIIGRPKIPFNLYIGAQPNVFKHVVIGSPNFSGPQATMNNYMGVAAYIHKQITVGG